MNFRKAVKTKDKEGCFMMMKGTVHQEEIKFINLYIYMVNVNLSDVLRK